MKLVFTLMFLLTSTLALATEVNTDCPWANQDGRKAGKDVRTSSSTTRSKSSGVVRQ